MSSDSFACQFQPGAIIDIDFDSFRKEFKILRNQRRLSQQDVAELLQISQATVSAFENGRYHKINRETLTGINRLLEFWKTHQAESNTIGFIQMNGKTQPLVPPSQLNTITTLPEQIEQGFRRILEDGSLVEILTKAILADTKNQVDL
jgi:transcriptional regulator with XRE-family HTH domain